MKATNRPARGAWLRVCDVASLLGVSNNTVRRWTDDGRLSAHRSPGGHRRYRRADVDTLLDSLRIGPPAPAPRTWIPRAGGGGAPDGAAEGLSSLIHAGQELADLLAQTPAEVPRRLAERLCRITAVPVCEVTSLDDKGAHVLASTRGGATDEGRLGASVLDEPRRRLAAGLDPDHQVRVVTRGEEGLDDDARALLDEHGCATLVFAPVMLAGRLTGTVELCSEEVGGLEREAGLAAGFAELAAHFLDTSAVVARLLRRERAARDLVELGAMAARTRDVNELLRGVARHLSTTLEASAVDIYGVLGDKTVCVASAGLGREMPDFVGDSFPLSDYPRTARALETGEPFLITDADDPRLSPSEREAFIQDAFACQFTVPLYAAGQAVGILEIFDHAYHDFGESLEFISSVGQMIAGWIESSTLVTDLERHNKLLAELIELSTLATRSADMAASLRSLGERLMETIDADSLEVYTLRSGRVNYVAGFSRGGGEDEWLGWSDELANYPLTAATLESRDLLVVPSLDDPRLGDHERGRYRMFGFESEICAPLVVEDRAIGYLDIFDTKPRDYAEFADFLRSAAPVIARALENSMLLDEVRDRAEALRELVLIGELLAQTLDLTEMVRLVALRLLVALDAASCDVYRLEGDTLTQLTAIGPEGFDDGVIGRTLSLSAYPSSQAAAQAGEPLVVASPDDPRLSPQERRIYEFHDVRSSICLPLLVGGRPIAMVDIDDTRERDFSGHLDFVKNVGRLLAGAFEKAFLLEQLEEGNRDLRQLVDAGLEFGASLELQEVLDLVASRMCLAVDVACCDIWRIEGDIIYGLAGADEGVPDPEFPGTTYPMEGLDACRLVMETLEPLAVFDVASDPNAGPLERSEWQRFGFSSGLLVPMITSGEPVGLAVLFSREPRDWGDPTAVRGLAQIAAQAIANAQVHQRLEETARRMTLMTEASMEFSSTLDLEQTLLAVGTRLCDTIGVPNVDINLLQPDGTGTCILSITDGRVDERSTGQAIDPEHFPLYSEIIATREPTVVENLDDPRMTPKGREIAEIFGERSWLTVPLIAKDRVIGMVDLIETRYERSFSDDEIQAALAVCRVAALAIDNADLFADVQARKNETEMLNAIAQKATAAFDMHEIILDVSDELRQVVPFARSNMTLVEGGEATLYRPHRPEIDGVRLADYGQEAVRMGERLMEERVVRERLPEDGSLWRDFPDLEGVRASIAIALVTDGQLVGSLNLLSSQPDAFDDVDTELLARVGTQVSLAVKNALLYRDIKRMHLNNLKALSSALNAKDYYTLGHAARVSSYMVLLGEKLRWPAELTRQVEQAAFLHDIGKIGISDRVLLKPGKLNSEEWKLMRQHPVFSAEIIQTLFDEDLVLGVRHHHERWDGKGYPDNLSGIHVPPIARAMCVVDSYDAMSFQRPYHNALDAPGCLDELRRCTGSQFDPEIVDAFLEVLADLDARRREAARVAAQAAARIDPRKHASLRSRAQESSADYQEIAAVLREVRDANPPTRYLTTQAKLDRRYVTIVDAEDDEKDRSPLGSDIFPDEVLQVLPRILAGEDPKVNALFADQYGVWITGLAPIRNAAGDTIAVVAADLAPFRGAESGGVRTAGDDSLAAVLQTVAVHSARAEVDTISDGLTGLYNHRYLHERLTEELVRSAEAGLPVSLLFCDLDHFAAFNEHLGHRVGDNALRSVAHVLEQSIRAVDLAARYGGEEFVVVLLETDSRGAFEVAERIRQRVNDTWVAPAEEPLSVSLGVVTFPADGRAKEELLDKADWAMHVAKRQGRNRVIAFSPDEGGGVEDGGVEDGGVEDGGVEDGGVEDGDSTR